MTTPAPGTITASERSLATVALLELLLDGLDPVAAAVELGWVVAYTSRLSKRLGYPSMPAMRASLALATGVGPAPVRVALPSARPRRSPIARIAALVRDAESHAAAAAEAAQKARYELARLSHDLAATPGDSESRAAAAALVARLSDLTAARSDAPGVGVAS